MEAFVFWVDPAVTDRCTTRDIQATQSNETVSPNVPAFAHGAGSSIVRSPLSRLIK